MNYFLLYFLLFCSLSGCIYKGQTVDKTTDTGSVSGRFTILENFMGDLAYRRDYAGTLKISLLNKRDTIASSYTSLEKFQFMAVVPGVYRISVEDSIHKEVISLESPEFQVKANQLTMVSSSSSRRFLNERANEWCIYRFDTIRAKKRGLLTLQFTENSHLGTGDTISLFISDSRVIKAAKPIEISLPESREVQLKLDPGFYELVVTFDKNETHYYSRLHLNIPILPEETFEAEINAFKELDMNVYLYMTNPKYHYKLYKSCINEHH